MSLYEIDLYWFVYNTLGKIITIMVTYFCKVICKIWKQVHGISLFCHLIIHYLLSVFTVFLDIDEADKHVWIAFLHCLRVTSFSKVPFWLFLIWCIKLCECIISDSYWAIEFFPMFMMILRSLVGFCEIHLF